MNIDMLRDADNDPGFYVAVCPADAADSWSGCQIFVSTDGGANYSSITSATQAAVIGITTNALANFLGGNIPDEISSVNVRLYANGTLPSTNNAGLLSGVNCIIIGDEILFYRDATLETDGTFTLRGFLRGRRGSEYAMSGHTSGDRFILAEVAKMIRIPQATADIGIAKKYKAVTLDTSLVSAVAKDFTNLAVGLMPYSPCQLGGGRNAAGDVILTWVRRNRISGEWRSSVDVPNSESSESYEIDILNGSTVVRTISVTAPTLTYTATQQTADFGAPQSSVHFNVYQLSTVVGRGHPAAGIV